MSREAFSASVANCTSCGETHEELIQFREFFLKTGSKPYLYWGWCPTTQEPILIKTPHQETP